jgi:cob(I)alamin adenosyltransferase
MSSFYTRKGDDGTTGLLGEGRVPKYHRRMEALGAIDEATAALGMARATCRAEGTASLIVQVQRDLYGLMAEVASTVQNAEQFHNITDDKVSWLETLTDAISARVQVPREFILPGDTPGGAALSLARTVVRRAERRVAELLAEKDVINSEMLRYLNRLSSLCFALELYENQSEGRDTSLAKP